jgi:hypothetical protein
MTSNLMRPVGNKKAKRMEKDNNTFARLMLMQQDNIKELTMSNKQVAVAIEKKRRSNNRQSKRSNLWQKLQF